ncbi:DUF6912 family protein [Xylanimonas protaetiae]|uniref:DUF6912 family protein n=1 Tax=Xylanimonas protaetiae TaxID=2509457 RepID=UPI001F5D8B4A|nr:hypothetical protein [Xylanimonas protaetiae]
MRLYVPATLDELDSAAVTATAATWTVPGRQAHAVTAALSSSLPDEDDEGLEWHAFLAAAHDSLLLVAGSPGVVPLRVVVTVEVPDDAVVVARDTDAAPSQVRLTGDVPGTVLVAVHVDEPTASPDVVDVLELAVSDAPGADAALDAAIQRITDRDLLWYAPRSSARSPAHDRPCRATLNVRFWARVRGRSESRDGGRISPGRPAPRRGGGRSSRARCRPTGPRRRRAT